MLYTIGAGTVVLALMAFSGVCWGVFCVCGESIFGLLEFWEVFGISTLTLVGSLTVRAVRKRRRDEPDSGPAEPLAVEPPEAEADRSAPAATSRPGGWRDLYNQLSEDERRQMKQLLNHYCAEDDPGSSIADDPSGLSHTDALFLHSLPVSPMEPMNGIGEGRPHVADSLSQAVTASPVESMREVDEDQSHADDSHSDSMTVSSVEPMNGMSGSSAYAADSLSHPVIIPTD